tara:strand:- start:1393 stop:2418 length:1026 start_codon:yes stop_codon:yes gene_type:complete
MIQKNKDIYFSYWLLLITFLVGLMIFVGGLTRLTDSGLSITRWDLFTGILPPITNNEWEKLFLLYQQIPEYKLINYSMSLEEFKPIFWWEYIHRLLGRIIGLFYLIPLLFFTIKKNIKKKTLIFLYIIFILILFQGFIGWYMVKSGLTERVDVSHYRLAMHLTLAFIIYTLVLWNYIKYTYTKIPKSNKSLPTFLPFLLTFCLLIQICIGALVSGLDAGQIYNTWPLMNNNYFPDDSFIKDLFTKKVLETPSIIQFIHRNMAYLIVLLFCYILLIVFNDKNFTYLRKNILLILLLIFLQIFLGIITLLSGVNIILASMHQIGSIFLISASLLLLFKNYKTN